MLNRKLIGILSIWGAIQCSAQDISVCNALKEANTTLKQYTIGTDEFSSSNLFHADNQRDIIFMV